MRLLQWAALRRDREQFIYNWMLEDEEWIGTNVYNCDNIIVYLLYLLFQENKSFGVRTICIHPLMWEAVSGTRAIYI